MLSFPTWRLRTCCFLLAGVVGASTTFVRAADEPTSSPQWKAVVDPPETTWELPRDHVPKIALRDHPVLHASMFGPPHSPYFSMFGEFLGDQVLRVWDLRNDKQIFEAKAKDFRPPIVVPNLAGTLVAAVRRTPPEIVVFSVASGKEVTAIPLGTTVARLAFAGDDVLLLLQARQTEAVLFAASTGKEIRRIDVGHPIAERNPFAITPGGRYLAMTHRPVGNRREPWKLSLFELANGKPAGQVALPPTLDELGDGGVAMDISPDGEEAAVLNLRKPVLVCVSLKDGKTTAELELATFTDQKERSRFARVKSAYGGVPLTFLPDRKGWLLYGHLLVDRKTGGLAWKVPFAEFGERTGPYRFVGDDRLLLLLPDRNSIKTPEGTSFAVLPWETK